MNGKIACKSVAVALAMVMMLISLVYLSQNVVHAESQADAIVSIALGEEGYGNSSVYDGDNKYGQYFGNNNVAWCAYFVSWCARQAGIPESIIKTNAWAGSMGSSEGTGNFGGRYYPKGSITPQKGDIVYYDWNKNGSSEHVEIVISVNESSRTFTSIGGNTKGDEQKSVGVRRHSNYSFTSSFIVGFERPNYSGSVIPPANDDELGIPYPRPQVSSTVWLGKNGITSGNYVKWLQTALNKADNAGLAVDGEFGSGTTAAVKSFQAKYGLTQDGQAGTSTINKLVEVIKGNIAPPRPSWAWISATNDRTSFAVGEEIHFWMSADETNGSITHYLIGINKGGERIITEECNGDYYISFDEPGDYSVYVSAYNTTGWWADSNTINFQIVAPTLDAPNLSVSVYDQEVVFEWNLVENATHYDVRIYYKDGTSYENYWGGSETQTSLRVTLPANTEFTAQVCAANKNFENCWTYCQPVSFKTGANSYTLTFNSNEGYCSVSNIEVTYGGPYGTLPTPTRVNYKFDGWYTEKSDGTKITSDTIVTVTSNQTLYAHWHSVYYQVLFDANGGICSKLSAPIQYRDTYGQLPEAQRDGYRFLGWYTLKDKGVLVTSDAVFLLTKDQTLYAHWELVDYQVSFDANGGSCSKLSAPIQYRDTYGQLPEAQRDGYRFLGWYTLKDKGVLVTSDTVFLLTKDQTLYAHWEKINLLGDLNGDTNITLTDLIPLQKHLLLRTHLTTEQSVLADLNSDGMINVIDLMLLKRTLLNP